MTDDKTTDEGSVEEELQIALDEAERLKDIAARAQADLQNAKDRLQREAADIRTFALEAALVSLLPTIDNFQRAFEHLPEDIAGHDWVKGIQATEKELVKQLEGMGLKKFKSLGEDVDPDRHEVLQTDAGEEGKVVSVLEEGYELNGKVVRPAKVVVGNGKS